MHVQQITMHYVSTTCLHNYVRFRVPSTLLLQENMCVFVIYSLEGQNAFEGQRSRGRPGIATVTVNV